MPKAAASSQTNWLVPGFLLVLMVVPATAGAARLVWLATGEIRPDSFRFDSRPVALVLHILSVVVFGALGAFQFAPQIRRRWPNWHRAAGRVLVVAGLIAASTGVWMTVFYPPGAHDGEWLYAMRLFFGSAMAASLLLGVAAIRRRDIALHRAWMMRGYAIGMGAGTQVVVFLPWFILVGEAEERPRAVLMGLAWIINLAIAEWIIRRRARLAPVADQKRLTAQASLPLHL